MEITTNLTAHRRVAESLDLMKSIEDGIEATFETNAVGSDGNIRIDFYVYGNNMHVELCGVFDDPYEVACALSTVLGFEAPASTKLRFNGNMPEYACSNPMDEWTLHPINRGGKVRAMICYRQTYNPEDIYYTVDVNQFPVPGYLVAAYERPEEVEERAKAAVSRPPALSPAPRFMGPEELSLCKKKEEVDASTSEA
jgi:hypothetical protein